MYLVAAKPCSQLLGVLVALVALGVLRALSVLGSPPGRDPEPAVTAGA
jgi:hypothetical protein